MAHEINSEPTPAIASDVTAQARVTTMNHVVTFLYLLCSSLSFIYKEIDMTHIVTIEDARAYCKSRMRDAVDCYYREGLIFTSPIELARFLARYW
jgi:hypothetical protein